MMGIYFLKNEIITKLENNKEWYQWTRNIEAFLGDKEQMKFLGEEISAEAPVAPNRIRRRKSLMQGRVLLGTQTHPASEKSTPAAYASQYLPLFVSLTGPQRIVKNNSMKIKEKD